MTKLFIILFIAFSFEAIGIITLKKGIDSISAQFSGREASMPRWKNTVRLVGDWFTNKQILIGLLLETIFFILLQYLLAQRDVSFVWPLTALSYVLTTLAAKYFLDEQVTVSRWGGVALIIAGAVLISYGEHKKEKPPDIGNMAAVSE